MNAFRKGQLLSATTASELSHHYREGLKPSGYRVPVNSKTLKAVTIKHNLRVIKVDGPLPAGTADQTVARSTLDHQESSFQGSVSASATEDGPKVELKGEHGGQPDASASAAPKPGTSVPLYRALVQDSAAVIPEYHTSRFTTHPADPPAKKYEPKGYYWPMATRRRCARSARSRRRCPRRSTRGWSAFSHLPRSSIRRVR